jgi:acyl carrier protein
MTDDEKILCAVEESLQIGRERITENLTYNSIPEWDSVAHMVLVAALEETFGVMLDTDDIVAMSSIAQIRVILKKYNVQ